MLDFPPASSSPLRMASTLGTSSLGHGAPPTLAMNSVPAHAQPRKFLLSQVPGVLAFRKNYPDAGPMYQQRTSGLFK